MLGGAALWGISIALSGIGFTVSRTLPDAVNVAREYVDSNNILENEAISEGYTPFKPGYSAPQVSAFILNDDGSIKPKAEFAAKKYLIISDSFKGRYMDERSRYAHECAVYDAFESNYDIVYSVDGRSGKYEAHLREGLIPNIGKTLSYLFSRKSVAGGIITIYDLAPKNVRLKNCETGEYLHLAWNGEASRPSAESAYDFVLYENDNDTVTLVSSAFNAVVCLHRDGDMPSYLLAYGEAGNEDAERQWTVLKKDDAAAFLICDDLALTLSDDTVCLSEYTGAPNQLWLIEG